VRIPDENEPWRPAGWVVAIVFVAAAASIFAEVYLGGGRIATFGAGFMLGIAVASFAVWMDKR
jgi:hypothetical protein